MLMLQFSSAETLSADWRWKGTNPVNNGPNVSAETQTRGCSSWAALCVQGITEITSVWEELASLPFRKIPNKTADGAKGGWGRSSGFWVSL